MVTLKYEGALEELISLQTAACGMVKQLMSREAIPLQVEQLPVLMHIYHHGFVCQQDVADAIFRDKSSIQRTIAKMAERGYLEIHKGKDKRKKLLTLSQSGIDIAARIAGLGTVQPSSTNHENFRNQLQCVLQEMYLLQSATSGNV